MFQPCKETKFLLPLRQLQRQVAHAPLEPMGSFLQAFQLRAQYLDFCSY